jgi:delta 1-pyrroline-5-carboxylate dehydrogenase
MHHTHFPCRQLLPKACNAQQGMLLRLGRCAGAPQDLVQVVTGYAEAGNALVTGGVDKVIFVGSTGVGKAVMQVNGPHHACGPYMQVIVKQALTSRCTTA